ncbi:CHRD domain-containing protein [Armatimonas sp.]|uniref:CHRD domain-containing protein n=1 Tax=Armatimonas sp. TaxID=1872638 RepID=UPI003753B7EA
MQYKFVNKVMTALAATLAVASSSHATIFQYDLIGTAGAGLLFGNEPAVATGGSGGEIGAGIFLDSTTNVLTVNVGWGSSQGFTDLSSSSSASHIHGPTASNFGSGFTQTAGVLFTLTRSSNLATGGTVAQAFTLSGAQVTDLNNGKHYINIHTATNGGGEIRGFIVPAVADAPEPGTLALLALGGTLVLVKRRRSA